MKKIMSLMLSLVLVLTLVACGEKKVPKDNNKKETKIEEKKEDKVSFERTPAKAKAEIVKIGLGSSVGLSAKPLKDGKGDAVSNVTIAGLAFDKDGKIVEAYIDVAQSKFLLKDDGTFAKKSAEVQFMTKQEVQDKYGMKKASKIKKEWFEQANAFQKYILGKTAEQVLGIETTKKDDNHLSVPTQADLVSSVTMDIGEFQKAVKAAWDNAVEVKGAKNLGLGVTTILGQATKEAKGDKGASVQFETIVALTATDNKSVVVKTVIDNAQNTISFNKDGSIMTDLKQPGTTKKALGDKYDMKKASKIKKEWFEQVQGLEKFAEGKTANQLAALKLEKGKATDADLLASTTITVEGLIKTLVSSIKTSK
ncbi:hypothetical protein EQF93_01660 [Helcococcus ovis]|uniref:hypothetical protein n=1 Tax=Helcococcus ovis TaxID=72026 RepID=UPI0010703657|nr:hypothetical protein [Helcococcus ovis]TFF68582.1 hypothetical protein EQF93_01660 [Helcococcus ovis]WNZ01309.1 hypothetical protein EQF90_000220 [Helcococcus ovis]